MDCDIFLLNKLFQQQRYSRQATSARYALPCFDEPEFKAKFDMTIQTEGNYSLVRWNTDQKTVEDMKYEERCAT